MKTKFIINLFLFLLLISIISCSKSQDKTGLSVAFENNEREEKPILDSAKTYKKALEALDFCKKNKFNTDFAILIDMSLHSGLKRFFVYDFKTEKITHQHLVGHGCGSNDWSSDESKDSPEFSNVDGSHLSSLGKYKIGARGVSEWGVKTKYLMHGLENTNNNALKRVIVFHSWERMSDEEIFPKGSPEGWGCPTLSNNAFRAVDPILEKSSKPVLMWIYQ
ncbi:murein L,D-transpeptidase catalytic domain family protein [Chryseobacterium foetidum]|uniref:murein L,D-transpeptidase catalytic domain family protein n=1 Tax=Chryseobacterium foetidum TaxID=2951057 RepID=UPI0021C9F351|nr:murein L,D-transpeptidase catalytic domain family protein [Chryseobacterium foetidum]